MWIKGCSEIVNLKLCSRIRVYECADGWVVNASYYILSTFETQQEAELVRDNIFYCLKQGEAAVDVADLRDVDLEKRDTMLDEQHCELYETAQDIADKIARSPDFVKQIEGIIVQHIRFGEWCKNLDFSGVSKGADKCVACLYVLGSPACIREKSKCTDTQGADDEE